MANVNQNEYALLAEIANDPLVTQTGLSDRLGMAVGSVNWYIKRLIRQGYVKVSHMDRTRLKYHLTPRGVSALTQRTIQYMQNSLKVYAQLRQQAMNLTADLKAQGVTQAYLEGSDQMMDILRLTCIEAGITIAETPGRVILKTDGQGYCVCQPAQKALLNHDRE